MCSAVVTNTREFPWEIFFTPMQLVNVYGVTFSGAPLLTPLQCSSALLFSSTTSVTDINTPMQLFRTAHPGFWNWHVPLLPEPVTLPNSQSILGLHFHFLPSALFRMLPCCKLKNKSASLHSKRLIRGCYFTPKTRLNSEESSCMSPLSHDLHHQGS